MVETFFELNHDLIYFAYGLVFFVMGLAIALQARASSQLDLARSLNWLAAFGFAHAFNEWGDLFVPIQAAYLSAQTVLALHMLHVFLLAGSFTFLFHFGVTLIKPVERGRWLYSASGMLLLVWALVSFVYLPQVYPDFDTWLRSADALARYMIGFPGGMIAAYGLRKHTFERILALKVPHIVRTLRFAGILMAFYAVFGGLVPPPAPFFPANTINSETFTQAFGFPPPVIRSLIGLGLAVSIIRALEVFDLETARMIEAMEQQQILSGERDRLARNLHDGAIQKVYTAGLLIESARKQASPAEGVVAERLERAEAVLNDAIRDLRHNLTELHAKSSEESLGRALEKIATDPRFRSLVDISIECDLPEEESLSPVRTDHVISVITEALSNAVRHARARNVALSARRANNRLVITITDDGIGIPERAAAGYGLRNMRDRARLLNGEVVIKQAGERGTVVKLDIPWKDER